MPLSEHEQRMLDQIEQALYAEDPKFASSVKGARLRKPSRRRRIQGVVLVMIGMSLLPLGVAIEVARPAGVPVVSVLGFLLMFVGVLIAVTSARAGGGGSEEEGQETSGRPSKDGGQRGSFTQRMEERFRDRFEDR
jgi:uncharacterized membrane protein